jgi:2-phosphosulfolactate phosphatase
VLQPQAREVEDAIPGGRLRIECEWGVHGARCATRDDDVVVVVDVLSFCSAVDIAVSQGVRVYPYPLRDDRLADFARSVGAEIGGHRGESRFSLSPACFLDAEPGVRVVLPSVNGGETTCSVASGVVLAGCLRNAGAVAGAVGQADRVVVAPAGEKWPDGSLRPAIEDWIGAGAIIDQLSGSLSSEARTARAAFRALRNEIASVLLESVSGKELDGLGYARDVELAAEFDVSDSAPLLSDGAFAQVPR